MELLTTVNVKFPILREVPFLVCSGITAHLNDLVSVFCIIDSDGPHGTRAESISIVISEVHPDGFIGICCTTPFYVREHGIENADAVFIKRNNIYQMYSDDKKR